ncbi:hypothetical protein JI640_14675 [Listeria ivanovii subsp. londoniensis]|uniref:hypothetical protein n=1 Tax=Listeria ivanovii TaxID=1638 RepID=UPI001903648E|nr:hypothetical protein [Listeria ivanovii]MBK1997149.1 hypothetical protein [Listeria ivanovii subsp. londoniensis]
MTKKTGRVVAKRIFGHDNVENKNLIQEYAELIFMNGRNIYELSRQDLETGKVIACFYFTEKPDVEFPVEAEWKIARTNFMFDDEYELEIKEAFKKSILECLVKKEKEIYVDGQQVFLDKAFLIEELDKYLTDNDFYKRKAMLRDGFTCWDYKTYMEITHFLERQDFEIARDVANRCEFKLKYFPATYENKEAYLEATNGKRVLQTFGYGASELYDKMI